MKNDRMWKVFQRANDGQRRTRLGLLLCVLGASATIIASPTAKSKSDVAAKGHRWFQIGKASWYGGRFQGHTTANGERFDMNALTCAHRSLPLGTWLRVTNLGNHRTTFVRVNDRGPLVGSRMLDLSYAAAQRLGLGGLSRVKIEPVVASDPVMTDALVAELVLDRNTAVADR